MISIIIFSHASSQFKPKTSNLHLIGILTIHTHRINLPIINRLPHSECGMWGPQPAELIVLTLPT